MTCLGFAISVTKWLPVLVTLSIFGWAWYAYVLQLILVGMQSKLEQAVCLTLFNILFILSTWSYLKTIFAPQGQIPEKFYFTPEISYDLTRASSEQQREEILAYFVKRNDLPVSCRTYSGGFRYCEKCNLVRPDRSHHCSICGVCILKMDHHCPWINNCVSFTNYKFFVLFLGHTLLMCLFVAISALPYFLKFWLQQDNSHKIALAGDKETLRPLENQMHPNRGDQAHFLTNNDFVPFGLRFNILFLFFISVMLSMGLVSLFFYHIYLLLNDRSTLESFRPPLMTYGQDRNAFNLGKKGNLYKLFGRSKLLWFVPVFTTEGDGITYEQTQRLGHGDEELCQGMNNHPLGNGRRNELTSGDSGVCSIMDQEI